MIFKLSEETKQDITTAGLGPVTASKFLRAYFLYPEFYIPYHWKISRKLFHKNALCRFIARLMLLRIYSTFNCILSPHAKIGKRLHLVHPYGVSIGRDCEIGDDVKIHQLVSIGRNHGDKVSTMPKIGNNVTIYIGACIMGGITIGDNAIIGANAVVTKDVPAGAIVSVPPPRVMSGIPDKYRSLLDGNDKKN